MGDPADVAKVAVFLVSDDVAWVTGVNLPVSLRITTGFFMYPRYALTLCSRNVGRWWVYDHVKDDDKRPWTYCAQSQRESQYEAGLGADSQLATFSNTLLFDILLSGNKNMTAQFTAGCK